MAIPDLPAGIPFRPAFSNFVRAQHHMPLVTMEVESGPDIARVQSKTRIKKFDVGFVMTDAEYALWETFAEVTLGQASGHFRMQVPLVSHTTFVWKRVYIDKGDWKDSPYAYQMSLVTWRQCIFVDS